MLPVLLVSLVLQTPTAPAATKPDFSGRWADVAPPPGQQGPARQGAPGRAGGAAPVSIGSGWLTPFTITQTATQLTVEYMFFGRGDMQPPLRHVFALDGSETQNTMMMGRGQQVQVTTAAWDGDKLVLKTVHTLTDPTSGKPITMRVTQILTLESPTTLVVEVASDGVMGGKPTSSKWTYQKQQ
jgi:hypothetical protein